MNDKRIKSFKRYSNPYFDFLEVTYMDNMFEVYIEKTHLRSMEWDEDSGSLILGVSQEFYDECE